MNFTRRKKRTGDGRGRKKEKKRQGQNKREDAKTTHASKRRVTLAPRDAGIGGARWCNMFAFHNLLNQTKPTKPNFVQFPQF